MVPRHPQVRHRAARRLRHGHRALRRLDLRASRTCARRSPTRARSTGSTRERQPRARVGVISLGLLQEPRRHRGHARAPRRARGATFVPDPAEADVIVVNTCAFIERGARGIDRRRSSRPPSYKKTGRAAAARRRRLHGAALPRRAARASLPEVDAFIGLDELDDRRGVGASRPARAQRPADVRRAGRAPARRALPLRRRDAAPPGHAAVDRLRQDRRGLRPHLLVLRDPRASAGAFRSRTPRRRRRGGRGAGARAACARSTSSPRTRATTDATAASGTGLAGLLRAPGRASTALRWIRVHYLYPNTVTDALIDAMAALPRVVDYVDMPLQHAHPDDAAAHAPGRLGGEPPAPARAASARAMPEVAHAHDAHRGLPRRDRRGVRGAPRLRRGGALRPPRRVHLLARGRHGGARARRRRPAEVKERAARPAAWTLQQRDRVERNRARCRPHASRCWSRARTRRPSTCSSAACARRRRDVDGQVLINDGLADAARARSRASSSPRPPATTSWDGSSVPPERRRPVHATLAPLARDRLRHRATPRSPRHLRLASGPRSLAWRPGDPGRAVRRSRCGSSS